MDAPNDNTEVIRMLRDFKDVMWKTVTPLKFSDRKFNEYVTNFSGTKAGCSGAYMPKIATKLNFSNMMDDTPNVSDSSLFKSFQTPDSLKRKLMNTEVELQTSRAKLKERESWISVMEPSNKKICIGLEQKLDQARKQMEQDAQKIEELKGKLTFAQSEAAFAKNQLHDLERQRKVDSDKMDMRYLALQQECSNLKIEAADLKSDKAETVRKLNNEIGRLELKLNMLSQDAEQSQDYIQTLKRQNNELAEKAAQWKTQQKELQEAQLTIQSLENKIEAEKDSALIVRTMQSELRLLSELQKENKDLKEELNKYKENNVTLFQEKMWSFQEKLVQAEKKNVALAKLQVENEQLKENILKWESLFDDDSASKRSPGAFSRKLSEYQKNEALLTNKFSQALAHCETLEKERKDLNETIKSLNQRLQRFQHNSPLQENVLRRLQRKVIFLTKERDSCRKLLDSYQSETTMNAAALNHEYISQLEDINTEYKRVLEKLENEVEELKRKTKLLRDSNKTEQLTAELNKLKGDNSSHVTQIEELKKENNMLKNTLAEQKPVQHKDSWDGKILHMRHNPFDSAVKDHLSQFRKIQEENDYLRKRIKVLEEEGEAAADVTSKVFQKLETEGADSTVKALKEQLAAAERQQKFILENARKKSIEFREAVYRLTGYRIDVPTAEKYKLSHVYADSKDDYLLFKVTSQDIHVIETEYSKQVTERMELYLHQHDSIPAFLASLTMDLFSQQTYMMSS